MTSRAFFLKAMGNKCIQSNNNKEHRNLCFLLKTIGEFDSINIINISNLKKLAIFVQILSN